MQNLHIFNAAAAVAAAAVVDAAAAAVAVVVNAAAVPYIAIARCRKYVAAYTQRIMHVSV